MTGRDRRRGVVLVMVCVDKKLERFVASFLKLVDQMFGLIGKLRVYHYNSLFRQIKCGGPTAFGENTDVTAKHFYFPRIIEHGTENFLLGNR